MKLCLRGITRIVFLVGRYAIKMPNFRYQHDHFLNGCLANWTERKYCRDFKNADYEGNMYNWVAPSYFCSWFGLFQIMARCEIYENHLTDKQKIFYEPLCGTDIKKENFGIYKDRLVCLDYA